MQSPALIIVADSHLGAAPDGDETAFLEFLDRQIAPGDTLLLAGDIYDYWFSYRRLIPRRNFKVTAALTHLARTNRVLMVGGNHDRWGDTFWSRDAGIEFAPHELRFVHGETPVLAIHGDGLHEERKGAGWMHSLTSNRLVIGAYRLLHPDLGFWIADRLGHNLDHGFADPASVLAAAARQLDWARGRMAEEPSLRIIAMGHTHHASLTECSPGRWYINPGPWVGDRSYAVVRDGIPTLHRFN